MSYGILQSSGQRAGMSSPPFSREPGVGVLGSQGLSSWFVRIRLDAANLPVLIPSNGPGNNTPIRTAHKGAMLAELQVSHARPMLRPLRLTNIQRDFGFAPAMKQRYLAGCD